VKYKNYPNEFWSQIEQALIEEKKQHKEPVAAFDADGTLWDTDLGESFFKYQIQQKLLPGLPADPWRHYRDWKEGPDPRPAYLWLAQINKGHGLQEVQSWAERAVAAREPLPIFSEQKKLIQFLRDNGVRVYIVTASVRWAVEPGALRLGLNHEDVIGVETSVESGIVSDRATGHMTYREGKAEALLLKTGGQAPFLTAGNTMGDFHLLKAASKLALAVGAAPEGHELFATEEKLRQEAKTHGWLSHRF
jgi:phosphoserine phosphatase